MDKTVVNLLCLVRTGLFLGHMPHASWLEVGLVFVLEIVKRLLYEARGVPEDLRVLMRGSVDEDHLANVDDVRPTGINGLEALVDPENLVE